MRLKELTRIRNSLCSRAALRTPWNRAESIRFKPAVEQLEHRLMLSGVELQVVSDRNGNGWSAHDPGLSGQAVSLYAVSNPSGSAGTQTVAELPGWNQSTDAQGRASWADLPSGTYLARLDSVDGILSDGTASRTLEVSDSGPPAQHTWAVFGTGGVAGTVFHDVDRNGIQEPQEVSIQTDVILSGTRVVSIYSADFGSAEALSFEGFSTTGLWHLTSQCHQDSEDPIAYFGIDGNCSFEDSGAAGNLTSPWIHLPESHDVELSFDHRLEGESGTYDVASVQISINGGPFQTIANDTDGALPHTNSWQSLSFDLTEFAGSQVQIRYRFDPKDTLWNVGLGWQIDNIAVSGSVHQQATPDPIDGFQFTGLGPGPYDIRLAGTDGWETDPALPMPLAITESDQQVLVTVPALPTRSVTGRVHQYGSRAVTGTPESQTGISGWQVFLDANQNGRPDLDEPSTRSNSNGEYRFSDVPDGSYRLMIESRPTHHETRPFYELTISGNHAYSGLDFPLFQYATVSGTIHQTDDATAPPTGHSAGLAGWLIYEDSNNDGRWNPGEPHDISRPDGSYELRDIGPGTKMIRREMQPGWKSGGAERLGWKVRSNNGGFEPVADVVTTILAPQTIGIGFQFPFLGSEYSEVRVDPQGFLTLGSADPPLHPPSLPELVAGPPRIAPLWSDWVLSPASSVEVRQTATATVVEWKNLDHSSGAASANFQVKLDASGDIAFHYGKVDLDPTGQPSLIGISPGYGSGISRGVDFLTAVAQHYPETVYQNLSDSDVSDFLLEETTLQFQPDSSEAPLVRAFRSGEHVGGVDWPTVWEAEPSWLEQRTSETTGIAAVTETDTVPIEPIQDGILTVHISNLAVGSAARLIDENGDVLVTGAASQSHLRLDTLVSTDDLLLLEIDSSDDLATYDLRIANRIMLRRDGALVVAGTPHDDQIHLVAGPTGELLEVQLSSTAEQQTVSYSNAVLASLLDAPSTVLIWGGDGDDRIEIDSGLSIPATILGNHGDDTISARVGADSIFGGSGTNTVLDTASPTAPGPDDSGSFEDDPGSAGGSAQANSDASNGSSQVYSPNPDNSEPEDETGVPCSFNCTPEPPLPPSNEPNVDLWIDKNDAPDPVAANGQIVYTITVKNKGPNWAHSVRMVDYLPKQVTFVSVSDSGCGYDHSAHAVTCQWLTVAPGTIQTVNLTVQANAPDGSRLSNEACVSSTSYEPYPDDLDNCDREDTDVEGRPEADLEIDKSANPSPAVSGNLLTYVLAVTNHGPKTATNVLVEDALPGGVQLISVSPSKGYCWGSVSCNLGTLANGASASVTIVVLVTADPGSTLVNKACVASDQADPHYGNNCDTVGTDVVDGSKKKADLAIEKSGDRDPVAPRDMLTYTIVVENKGPDSASGVVVRDALPRGVRLLSATSTKGKCSGPTSVNCLIGVMASGQVETVTIKVQVRNNNLPCFIDNTAVATSRISDPDLSNNGASERTTTTACDPLLSIGDSVVWEGDSGTRNAKFRVSLSRPSEKGVTFRYSTSDITAVEPEDYLQKKSILRRMGKRRTTLIVRVPIVGDTISEPDEYFRVRLHHPRGADILDGEAYGLILDDDGSRIVILPGTEDSPQTCIVVCHPAGAQPISSVKINPQTGSPSQAVRSRGRGSEGSGFVFSGNRATGVSALTATALVRGGDIPDTMTVAWTVAEQPFPPITYNTTSLQTGDQIRLSLPVDTTNLPTGHHPYQITITTDGKSSTSTGFFDVVNLSSSPYGAGWWMSGLEQLFESPEGALIVLGDGTSRFFPALGTGFGPAKGTFSKLSRSGDGGFRRDLTDGSQRIYSAAGLLVARRDEFGRMTTFNYADTDGDAIESELRTMTDPYGRETQFEYSNGKLSRIADWGSRESFREYDSIGNLSAIIDANDGRWSYTYGLEQFPYRLTSFVPPSDQGDDVFEERLAYDDSGRVSRWEMVNQSNGEIVAWEEYLSVQSDEWPSVGGSQNPVPISIESARRAVLTRPAPGGGELSTVFVLDPLGNVVEIHESFPDRTTRFERNENGLVTNQVDALGRITSFRYDELGKPTLVSFPDGSNLRYQYDETLVFSRVASVQDSSGATKKFEYDQAGRPVRVVAADGAKTTLGYGTGPKPIRITDPGGNDTRFTYDSFDRTQSILLPESESVSFQYDTWDRISRLTDQQGRVNQFVYDALDQLTQVTDPSGIPVRLDYDPRGNPRQTTLRSGAVSSSSYDGLNRLVSSTDRRGFSAENQYDVSGSLVATVDRRQSETRYQYDQAGRLVAMVSPTGGTQRFEYDLMDRITRTQNPLGAWTAYEYDDRDRLVRSVNPLGAEILSSYDIVGRLTTQETVDWNLSCYESTSCTTATNSYRYDAEGRLLSDLRNGLLTEYTYDPVGNLTHHTVYQPWAATHTYEYDGQGRLTSKTDPNANSSQWTRANGVVESFRDALGRETSYSYNASGQLESTVDPTGSTTSYLYDTDNNLVSIQDPLGNSTTFVRNELGWVDSWTDPLGNTTSYLYDPEGNLIQLTDPLGNATNYDFDQANRLIQTTSPLGNSTQLEYNQAGLRSRRIDPNGNTTAYHYDLAGHETRVVGPLGNETTINHSSAGRLLSATRPDGVTTLYEYDSGQNVARKARSHHQDYDVFQLNEFDVAGRLVATGDDTSNLTRYYYDRLGQKVLERDPWGRTISRSFDAVGNLTLETDRNGRRRSFNYDPRDNLVSEIWWDGSEQLRSFHYSYNPVDQLISAYDNSAAYANEFDAAGRLIGQTANYAGLVSDFENSYSLNNGGQITQVDRALGDVASDSEAYLYDPDGRRTSVEDGQPGDQPRFRITLNYDPIGNLTQINRAEKGVSVHQSNYTYDARNQLVQLQHQSTHTTPIPSFQVHYTTAGRISQTTEQSWSGQNVTKQFDYDLHDQLTRVTSSELTEAYSFDAAGNRISALTGGLNTSYSYQKNRLTRDTQFLYEYDSEGNLIAQLDRTTGETRTYQWDQRNRLQRVAVFASTGTALQEATYQYDIFDRRISKTVDRDGPGPEVPYSEYYFYDRDQIVLELLDVDGESGPQQPQLHRRNIYGPAVDQLFASEDGQGNMSWLLTDWLGSTRYLTDASANLTGRIDYDSFGQPTATGPDGEPIAAADLPTRFLFSGREFDAETEMQYHRTRYYLPRIGRWISEDSLGFSGGDPNLYRYVGNTPNQFVDPSGNFGQPPGKKRPYPALNSGHPNADKAFHDAYLQTMIEAENEGVPFELAQQMAYADAYAAAGELLDNDHSIPEVRPPERSPVKPYENPVRDYIVDTTEQVVMGDYSDKVTAAGTGIQILGGLTGLDALGDVRDLSEKAVNWEWSWSHGFDAGVTVVGLLPVVGVLKYTDEISDVVKGGGKATRVANSSDDIHDAARQTDEVCFVAGTEVLAVVAPPQLTFPAQLEEEQPISPQDDPKQPRWGLACFSAVFTVSGWWVLHRTGRNSSKATRTVTRSKNPIATSDG